MTKNQRRGGALLLHAWDLLCFFWGWEAAHRHDFCTPRPGRRGLPCSMPCHRPSRPQGQVTEELGPAIQEAYESTQAGLKFHVSAARVACMGLAPPGAALCTSPRQTALHTPPGPNILTFHFVPDSAPIAPCEGHRCRRPGRPTGRPGLHAGALRGSCPAGPPRHGTGAPPPSDPSCLRSPQLDCHVRAWAMKLEASWLYQGLTPRLKTGAGARPASNAACLLGAPPRFFVRASGPTPLPSCSPRLHN